MDRICQNCGAKIPLVVCCKRCGESCTLPIVSGDVACTIADQPPPQQGVGDIVYLPQVIVERRGLQTALERIEAEAARHKNNIGGPFYHGLRLAAKIVKESIV